MAKKKLENNDEFSLEEHEEEQHLFNSLDTESKGYIYKDDFFAALNKQGIHKKDGRLKVTMENLAHFSAIDKISAVQFIHAIKNNFALIKSALTGNLIIPDFENFCHELQEIYTIVNKNNDGNVATYIPQLARINPNQFGISICTIDGQLFSIGDAHTYFSVQSTCKPINYCVIQEEHGEKKVHQHIGKEPSGHGFNVLSLNQQDLPHNPLNNAGAIMACSLIRPHLDSADRFDYIIQIWKELSGYIKNPVFNNAIYLSEKVTADRNFALAHFMREKNAFPPGVNLNEILEFYFQCCSIEMTTESMAVVASTLANAGICPLTETRVFEANTVKNCLSLMSSCGMYDFSGEFAFSVGLPAKSGVSGAIVVIVPNVMGICIWSPRLDHIGNSVRGLQFCQELIKRFNFHNFDNLVRKSTKKDPRRKKYISKISEVMSLLWAASNGDVIEIKRLIAVGVDLDKSDYDGRTALHLAASEGQLKVVSYLIKKKVFLNPIDRWGRTPLSDAYTNGSVEVIRLLERHGAKREQKK